MDVTYLRDFTLRTVVQLAGYSRLSRKLQRWPRVYALLRAGFGQLVGGGMRVRRIEVGPLRGRSLVLEPNDRNAYLLNDHEPQMVRLVTKLCLPGMHALDIGAHVGYFSLLISQLVGSDGGVGIFEPNPRNVEKIRRMLQENKLSNAVLYPYAASDRDGDVYFEMESTGQMGRIIPSISGKQDLPSAVVVKAVAIDSLPERSKLGRIDFVKLDVEGAENGVLKGLSRTLLNDRPIVLAEWHPAHAGLQYEAAFASFGYQVELLEPASKLNPFHILARHNSGV